MSDFAYIARALDALGPDFFAQLERLDRDDFSYEELRSALRRSKAPLAALYEEIVRRRDQARLGRALESNGDPGFDRCRFKLVLDAFCVFTFDGEARPQAPFVLPSPFEYLQKPAEKFRWIGIRGPRLISRSLQRLTGPERAELGAAYEAIESRDGFHDIARFLRKVGPSTRPDGSLDFGAIHALTALIQIFNNLADQGTSPFDRFGGLPEVPAHYDWSELPEEYRFLIAPAQEFEKESEKYERFNDIVAPQSVEELTSLKARYESLFDSPAYERFKAWRDGRPHGDDAGELLYWFVAYVMNNQLE